MANATPYDGGSIGGFLGDAIRNIKGDSIQFLSVRDMDMRGGKALGYYRDPTSLIYAISGGDYMGWTHFWFDASLSVPTALENRVASVSVWYGISY
jgi:hypothetical protein